jgi:hypothetical protein
VRVAGVFDGRDDGSADGGQVGGPAAGPAGCGVLAPAADLDGLAGAREVRAADVNGLQGPDLDAAVPGVAGKAADWYLPPGQGLIRACGGWFFFTIAM